MTSLTQALLRSTALVALVLFGTATPTQAGLDPALKCESAKLKAAGKKTSAALKCHAKAAKKAIAVDPACLSKAETKFAASFVKAEKTVACAEPGDALTVGPKIDAYVVAAAAALNPGGDEKCASKKLGALAKKGGALFNALSKDAKKPDAAALLAGFTKAQDKFSSAFAKSEDRLPCSVPGDAGAVRLALDAMVEDVIGFTGPSCPQELVYSTESNRIRRYDVDTIGSGALVEDILIERASVDPVNGRDVNGEICFLPDASGRFLVGEDTGQPSPPPGWGLFDSSGTQIGKNTPTFLSSDPETFGCGFDAAGNFFSSTVGDPDTGSGNGQLIMWFAPFDEFPGPLGAYPATDDPSTNFCKLAVDLATAGAVAVDDSGRVYVASARVPTGPAILRYSPPFPTGPDAAGGCGLTDAAGSPLADSVNEEIFILDVENVATPSGIVAAPNGNWWVSSVLTGVIAEYDENGAFVRRILEPFDTDGQLPLESGHPQGLAADCAGNLYYADLALIQTGGGGAGIGPGPNGTVRRVTFDLAGVPREPELVRDGLSFPDGVEIVEGDLE